MSSVRYEFPKYKLTQQLREPGGLAVADAVDGAAANLEELRPECADELQKAVSAAMACFQAFPPEFDPAALQELYAIAARAVGIGVVCGAPAADATLVSLCNLLDHLGVIQRWDLAAVAVHVQTLQLLAARLRENLEAPAIEQVLAGLEKVTRRYRLEAAIAHAASA
ncbi:MAG TPA: hypothetical protein VN694_05090 [Caulobacteraceae bacterium]|nr:hypothetical protein [Caulobacteraceae bacterium]